MRMFYKGKDGGPESTVTGYWLVEFKRLFSVALLRFTDGSRDAYHDHAFNAVSWVLRGKLVEKLWPEEVTFSYTPSWRPIFTHRHRMHRVVSRGTTWVLTLRGPWTDTWFEYRPREKRIVMLADGRKEV